MKSLHGFIHIETVAKSLYFKIMAS